MGQQAVIGNLLPEMAPDNRAFERFTNEGPIALPDWRPPGGVCLDSASQPGPLRHGPG
jgi:hypothetical protein